MNEQTTKLLETLAQKLGTTTEYLWSVLLKQAPIDATITLIQIGIVVLFNIILYKVHKRFIKSDAYENYDVGAPIFMVLMAVILLISDIACMLSLNSVVNGFFNPEYWALREIIGTIKQ